MTPKQRRLYAWQQMWERHFSRRADHTRHSEEYAKCERWRNDMLPPTEFVRTVGSNWNVLLTPMALKRLERLPDEQYDDFWLKLPSFNTFPPANSVPLADGPVPYSAFCGATMRGNLRVIFLTAVDRTVPFAMRTQTFASYRFCDGYEDVHNFQMHIFITDIVPLGKETPSIKNTVREINNILAPIPALVPASAELRVFKPADPTLNPDGSVTQYRGRGCVTRPPKGPLQPRVAAATSTQELLAATGVAQSFVVTDALRKAITSMVTVLHATGLKFTLSPEEERVLVDPHSVICLGRSGTGKTTTALLRLWSRYREVADRAAAITEGLPLKETPAPSPPATVAPATATPAPATATPAPATATPAPATATPAPATATPAPATATPAPATATPAPATATPAPATATPAPATATPAPATATPAPATATPAPATATPAPATATPAPATATGTRAAPAPPAAPAPASTASAAPTRKDFRLHCIFITLSPLLCSQVRTLFLRLFAAAKHIASTGDEESPGAPLSDDILANVLPVPPPDEPPVPPPASPSSAIPPQPRAGPAEGDGQSVVSSESSWVCLKGDPDRASEATGDDDSASLATTSATAEATAASEMVASSVSTSLPTTASLASDAALGGPEMAALSPETRARLAMMAALGAQVELPAAPAGGAPTAPRDILECDPSLSDEEYARMVPESLSQLRDEHFPLFLALDQFLMMLDASLEMPFFARPSRPLAGSTAPQAADPSAAAGAVPTPMLCWSQGGGQLRRIRRRYVEAPTLGLAGEDEDEDDLEADIAAFEKGLPRITRKVAPSPSKGGACETVETIDASSFEVDYPYFAAHMYPKMHESALEPYPAALVWTEIQTHIKGSAEACESRQGCLDCAAYLALGAKRSFMLPADRQAIYGLFQRYEALKRREDLYDRADFIGHIWGQLTHTGGYKGTPIHSVTVDEVQDWTQSALKMLFRGHVPDDRPRVGFRFCDLQSLFYEQSRRSAIRREEYAPPPSTSSPPTSGPPGPTGLPVLPLAVPPGLSPHPGPPCESSPGAGACRTHADILRLCNSVVSLLERLFPASIEHLQHDQGTIPGPKPQLFPFHSAEQLYLLLGGTDGAGSVIEFGAQQVVLVRTAQARDTLPPMLRHALCMTTFEAKGLEFEDVLLYNFFADSPATADEWQAAMSFAAIDPHAPGSTPAVEEAPEEAGVKHAVPAPPQQPALGGKKAAGAGGGKAEREERKRQRAAQVQLSQQSAGSFEGHRYHLLCSELKQLYTAVSRARRRVFVFDADVARRRPVLEWWASEGIAQWTDPKLGTAADVATKSTPAQWRERGLELLGRGFYEQAQKCFQFAGDGPLQTVCQGYLLAARAEDITAALPRRPGTLREPLLPAGAPPLTATERQQRAEAARVFEEAAAKFVEGGAPPLLGARALASAGHYDRAAALFEAAGRVDLACECFTLGAVWTEAARCQLRLGRPYEAARAFLLASLGPGDATALLDKAAQCAIQALQADRAAKQQQQPAGGPAQVQAENGSRLFRGCVAWVCGGSLCLPQPLASPILGCPAVCRLFECLSLHLLRGPAPLRSLRRVASVLLQPRAAAHHPDQEEEAASLTASRLLELAGSLMQAAWLAPAFALLCAGLQEIGPTGGRPAEGLARVLFESLPAVVHAVHHGAAAEATLYRPLVPMIGTQCQAALQHLGTSTSSVAVASRLLASLGWTEPAYALARPAAPTLAGSLALQAGRYDLLGGLSVGLAPEADAARDPVLLAQTRAGVQAALGHLCMQAMSVEVAAAATSTSGPSSATTTPAPSPTPDRPRPRSLINGHPAEEFARALGAAPGAPTPAPGTLASFVERLLRAAFPSAALGGGSDPMRPEAALAALTGLLAAFPPADSAGAMSWPAQPVASRTLAWLLGLAGTGRPVERCGLLDPVPFTASSAPTALQEQRLMASACAAPQRAGWLVPAAKDLPQAAARPHPDPASPLWVGMPPQHATLMALNTVVIMGLQLLRQRLPWFAEAATPAPSPVPAASPEPSAQGLNSKQRRQLRKQQEQAALAATDATAPTPQVARLVQAVDLAWRLRPAHPAALCPAEALRMLAWAARARHYSAFLGQVVLPAHRPLYSLLGLRPSGPAAAPGVFLHGLEALATLGLVGLAPLSGSAALEPAEAALVAGMLGQGALARLDRLVGHMTGDRDRRPASDEDEGEEESEEGDQQDDGEEPEGAGDSDGDEGSSGPRRRHGPGRAVDGDGDQDRPDDGADDDDDAAASEDNGEEDEGPSDDDRYSDDGLEDLEVSGRRHKDPQSYRNMGRPPCESRRAVVRLANTAPAQSAPPRKSPLQVAGDTGMVSLANCLPVILRALLRCQAADRLAPGAQPRLAEATAKLRGAFGLPATGIFTALATWMGLAGPMAPPSPAFMNRLTSMAGAALRLVRGCMTGAPVTRPDEFDPCWDVPVTDVPHLWAALVAAVLPPSALPPVLRMQSSMLAAGLATVALATAVHGLTTHSASAGALAPDWQTEMQTWVGAMGRTEDLLDSVALLRASFADVLGGGQSAPLMKSCEPVLKPVRTLISELLSGLTTAALHAQAPDTAPALWEQVALAGAMLGRLLESPPTPLDAILDKLAPRLSADAVRALKADAPLDALLSRLRIAPSPGARPASAVSVAVAAAIATGGPDPDTLAYYEGGEGFVLVEDDARSPGQGLSCAEMLLSCRELLLRHPDLPPTLRAQCARAMVDLTTGTADSWEPLVVSHQAWQGQRLEALKQTSRVLTPEQIAEKERLARQQAMQLELRRRRNLKRQRHLLKKAFLAKLAGRS
ncbi:hypothetical protein PAPYR_3651 [Paratrimastix pyriformis]|uniref:UvrD-like helicase ATP-binding domain-containing protein n=1 Tax=Paratrimastix pyriformis TaxID=342808 RepID=A0ABQ8UM44_9EUKA|nr:hypothetical protein PAPYR_3651 [Paratrimastix pyriformis]